MAVHANRDLSGRLLDGLLVCHVEFQCGKRFAALSLKALGVLILPHTAARQVFCQRRAEGTSSQELG